MSGIDWKSEEKTLIQMVNEYKTLEDIGNYYGVSRERVRQVLKGLGLKTKNRPSLKDVPSTYRDRIFWIRQLKRDWVSFAAMAKRFRLTEAQVKAVLDIHGLTFQRMTTEERFWSYVKRSENLEKCWEWQGYRDPNGYGKFTIEGDQEYTHRVSWEFFHQRTIPKGLFVLHNCNNTSCVNPHHLRLGNQKENMRDRTNADRGSIKVGAAILHPVLTLVVPSDDEPPLIFKSISAAAKYLGVDQSTVSAALAGKLKTVKGKTVLSFDTWLEQQAPKNYQQKGDRFEVYKNRKYVGSFSTEEEAKVAACGGKLKNTNKRERRIH